MDVEGLIGKLQAFANGCRGSMWQSRNETITLMDKAAEALSRQKAAGAAMKEALRDVRDNGLIYWEPNTERGARAKETMLARIDATLNSIGADRED